MKLRFYFWILDTDIQGERDLGQNGDAHMENGDCEDGGEGESEESEDCGPEYIHYYYQFPVW